MRVRVRWARNVSPAVGASPHIGSVGEIEQVAETRLEMVALRRLRSVVTSALRDAHPYEEPAFDIVELADIPARLAPDVLASWISPRRWRHLRE